MKRSRRSSTLPRCRSTSSPCDSTASSSDESTTPAARASSSRRTVHDVLSALHELAGGLEVAEHGRVLAESPDAGDRREGVEVDAPQRRVAPVLVLERRQGRACERRARLAAAFFEPCRHQPTEPSICSWIRRFISTAYSSGSSLVIGSTKPATIIAAASLSESPRLRR